MILGLSQTLRDRKTDKRGVGVNHHFKPPQVLHNGAAVGYYTPFRLKIIHKAKKRKIFHGEDRFLSIKFVVDFCC